VNNVRTPLPSEQIESEYRLLEELAGVMTQMRAVVIASNPCTAIGGPRPCIGPNYCPGCTWRGAALRLKHVHMDLLAKLPDRMRAARGGGQ
jgi:hypothetical protein